MVRCNSVKDAHPADGTNFIQHKTRYRRQTGRTRHLLRNSHGLSVVAANPLWVYLTQGFGNKITMVAYPNRESPSHGGGCGLTRFDKQAGTVTFECWPREVDASG